MDSGSPVFNEYIRRAEVKLGDALGGTCRITVYHEINVDLLRVISEIEDERFRSELRYSERELRNRSNKSGFTCFLVYLDGRPIAFVFGFDDPESGSYFSDSAATLIERKGIASVLTALESLYCIENGYTSEKMITEDLDESGRRLVEYWRRFGFQVTNRDPKIGVEMRLELTPAVVNGLLEKYLP
jgi:hypothetical protein